MSGRQRVVLAVAAAGLLAANVANLLGASYERAAEEKLQRPRSDRALQAARLAAALPPWSSTRAALHGWILAENGDPGADAAYRRALWWAPADALLWSEYTLALARLGRFDDTMARAVTTAARLAPTSPAVRGALAEQGLSYWNRGSPALRAQWLESMRYALDRDRPAFLGQVLAHGRVVTFCDEVAPALGERRWCEAIAPALASGCFSLRGPEPAPCDPAP